MAQEYFCPELSKQIVLCAPVVSSYDRELTWLMGEKNDIFVVKLSQKESAFAFVKQSFCICRAECRYSCRSWLSDWPVREKWSARHNGEKSLRAHILELDKGTHGQKSIYPPSIMAELRALLPHILCQRKSLTWCWKLNILQVRLDESVGGNFAHMI